MDDASAEQAPSRDDATVSRFPSIGVDSPIGALASLGLRDAIGDVLRDERLHQERTLAEVASDANVSLPYLSEVERGRKDVSSELLTSICDALQLPVSDLLERTADRLRARSQRGLRTELLLAA